MIATILAASASGLILCADPRITDGDTFRCDGALKIRLWGIDAPEAHTPEGPASTRALSNITRGQTLVCTSKGKSHDRTVAQCWIGKSDVGKHLACWCKPGAPCHADVLLELANRPTVCEAA